MRRVKISSGNTKIGNTPNISLPPIQTCVPQAPCSKKCYAMKAWKQYPNVRKAWTNNLGAYCESPSQYFKDVSVFCQNKRPKYFRWHVAGDIPDQQYFEGMKDVAKQNPDTIFLAYTKKYYQIVFHDIPENLTLIMSAWPDFPIAKSVTKSFPVAWLSHDERIKDLGKDPIMCNDMCERCGMICYTKNRTQDVIFDMH